MKFNTVKYLLQEIKRPGTFSIFNTIYWSVLWDASTWICAHLALWQTLSQPCNIHSFHTQGPTHRFAPCKFLATRLRSPPQISCIQVREALHLTRFYWKLPDWRQKSQFQMISHPISQNQPCCTNMCLFLPTCL